VKEDAAGEVVASPPVDGDVDSGEVVADKGWVGELDTAEWLWTSTLA